MRLRRRRPEEPAEVPEDVAAALASGPFAGRAVTAVRIEGSEEVAVLVGIDPGDLVEDRRAVQALVAPLGRLAVGVASWDDEGWAEQRLFALAGDDVLARAARTSPADGLAWFAAQEGDWAAEHWEEVVDAALALTAERVGSAPPRDALLALAPDEAELERRLLAFEEQARPSEPGDPADDDWYDPRGQAVALALLPIGAPEEAAAFVSFYGSEGPGGDEALIAVLRDWRERFGAELVAHWGTMLQLVADRPPGDLDSAFALAREQQLVAPDTLALPGEPLRDHAGGSSGAAGGSCTSAPEPPTTAHAAG